jgi:hypothetical protein
MDAADQLARRGGRAGRESGVLQFRQHKRVDGIGDPLGSLHGGDRRPYQWAERPVGAGLVVDLRRSVDGAAFDRSHRRALLDPFGQQLDLGIRQFAGGRHLEAVVTDGGQQ